MAVALTLLLGSVGWTWESWRWAATFDSIWTLVLLVISWEKEMQWPIRSVWETTRAARGWFLQWQLSTRWSFLSKTLSRGLSTTLRSCPDFDSFTESSLCLREETALPETVVRANRKTVIRGELEKVEVVVGTLLCVLVPLCAGLEDL